MSDGIDWLFNDDDDSGPASRATGATDEPEKPKRARHATMAYWLPRAENALALLAQRAGAGRPTKLTPARLARLLAAIGDGDTLKAACGKANVNYSNFYLWRQRGLKNEPGYLQFHKLIERAVALAESDLRRAIKRDASWQSKAWLLERRNPAEYGRQQKLDVQVSGSIEHKHEHTHTLQPPPNMSIQTRLAQLQTYVSTPELANDMSPASLAGETGDISNSPATPADYREVPS